MGIIAILKVTIIVWGLLTVNDVEWCGDRHKACFYRDGVVPENLIEKN